MRRKIRAGRVAGLMASSFFLSFGFQAFTSSFYLYCVRRFGFGAKEYGQVLSSLGMTWTTTQGAPPLVAHCRAAVRPAELWRVVGRQR